MLIHPWDAASDDEWREVVRHVSFGQLVAVGTGDRYPTVVPTHYVLEADDRVLLHLARPNPVWERIEQNPCVVLSVVADYVYVEAAWNADPGTPPERGVPTSYYAAVQLRGTGRIVDEPGEKLDILRKQVRHFEPDGSERLPPSMDAASDRRRLPGIRGLVVSVESVEAKLKYGGNKAAEHRLRIAEHLAARNGPLDHAARGHLLRRAGPHEAGTGGIRLRPGETDEAP